MEIIAKQQKTTTRQVLADVYEEINWAYLAKNYFGKSRSWLAHKINGDVINGKPVAFTEEERQTFKHALADMSAQLGSLGVSL